MGRPGMAHTHTHTHRYTDTHTHSHTPHREHCVTFLPLWKTSDIKMSIKSLLSHLFRTGHTEQHDGKWWPGGTTPCCAAAWSAWDCLAVWISGCRQTQQDWTHTHTHTKYSFTKAIVMCVPSFGLFQHVPTTNSLLCYYFSQNTVLSFSSGVYTKTNIVLIGGSEELSMRATYTIVTESTNPLTRVCIAYLKGQKNRNAKGFYLGFIYYI